MWYSGVTKISFESGVCLPKNCNYLFSGVDTLESINLSNLSCPDGLEDLIYIFAYCPNLKEINLGNLDVSGAYNMNSMFEGCTSLETIDLSNMNLENAYGYEYMFSPLVLTVHLLPLNLFFIGNRLVVDAFIVGVFVPSISLRDEVSSFSKIF
jgi:surface protein